LETVAPGASVARVDVTCWGARNVTDGSAIGREDEDDETKGCGATREDVEGGGDGGAKRARG
jgi:hypothetical protein